MIINKPMEALQTYDNHEQVLSRLANKKHEFTINIRLKMNYYE